MISSVLAPSYPQARPPQPAAPESANQGEPGQSSPAAAASAPLGTSRPLGAFAIEYWATYDTRETINGPISKDEWFSLSRAEQIALARPAPKEIQDQINEGTVNSLQKQIELEQLVMKDHHYMMSDKHGFLAYLESAVPEAKARLDRATGSDKAALLEEFQALSQSYIDKKAFLTRMAEEWPAVKAKGEARIAELQAQLAAFQQQIAV
jgi:hypothetical protein